MKLPVLLSIFMHSLLFAVLIVLPTRSRSLPRTRKIYQVELVSVPRVVKEAHKEAESRPLSRQTKPAPVVAQVKPVKRTIEPSEVVEKEEIPETTITIDSTEAVSSVGSSQVKVDTEDFPFAYYLSLIRYRIQENWRPPFQTLAEGEKMTAIVGFRIIRNGSVENVNLEHASNRFLFDQAAQRAIHAMGKLPPLPDEFSGDHLTVHIEFESVW